MDKSQEAKERASRLIALERARQDAKWGEQNHFAPTWILILMEEIGEVSKTCLEADNVEFITELTQVAAVATAWLECELRNIERHNEST